MRQVLCRFFVTAVFAMMCITLMAESVVIDGITYDVNTEEKTAEVVSGESSYTGEISIPSSFMYEGNIYSVMSIGDWAFYRCNVTSIIIPNSIANIGNSAFESCCFLTSIVIPESVMSIGEYAFALCRGLTSINLPDAITSISTGVFYSCEGLRSIVIPESVKNIGQLAFAGCYNLTTINIPASVDSIGTRAFFDCISLESLTIQNGVDIIDEFAFQNCSCLSSVFIPASVGIISGGSFEGCMNLSNIEVDIENPYFADIDGIVYNKDLTDLFLCPGGKIGEIIVPSSVQRIINRAFVGCHNILNVTLPDNVKVIEAFAFHGCYNLTTINIPDGVTCIESEAFCDCYHLQSINIPGSVTCIGGRAFKECISLESLTIQNGVEMIDEFAFQNCSNLSSVFIPTSVGIISGGSFEGCMNLCKIEVDSENPYFTDVDGIVYSKDETEIVLCPCGKSGVVILPSSVQRVVNRAFVGCQKIAIVILPENLTNIEPFAFHGCSNLTSINIPNGVTNIESQSFAYCTSLSAIEIPMSVTCISNYAFWGCSNLKTIYIPRAITCIENHAFGNCNGIKDVYCYASSVPSVENDIFELDDIEYQIKAILHVPNFAIDEYKEVEPWNRFIEILPISEEYVLSDNVEYFERFESCYLSVSYTRNFPEETVGTWQAMCLPISINVEDYKDDFDIAEIYTFSPYRDTNGDGVLDGDDDNFMFVSIKQSGWTEPYMPYSIRPKHAGNITMYSRDGILHAAREGEVVLATSRNLITITGLSREKTLVAGDGNYYVAIDGTLCNTTTSTTIKPYRWVLNLKPRNYGGGINTNNNSVKQIGILAVGEDIDEETAIRLIEQNNEDDNIYAIDGKNVSNIKHLPAGMYIKNGKKYIVK